jgi:FdhD protein
MLAGIDTRDRIILTTGRVSSDMINKARHMNVPVVCSRTSPTSMSVALAEHWHVTLVGYLRRNSMNIYTHPEHVALNGAHQPAAGEERITEEALHGRHDHSDD